MKRPANEVFVSIVFIIRSCLMQTLASLTLEWYGSEVTIETIKTNVQSCVYNSDETNFDAPIMNTEARAWYIR